MTICQVPHRWLRRQRWRYRRHWGHKGLESPYWIHIQHLHLAQRTSHLAYAVEVYVVQVCLSLFTQPALNSCSPPREQHLHLLLESSGHLLQAAAAPGRTRCSKCKPPTPSSAKLSAGCGHVASGGRSGTSPGAQFKTAVHMDTVQNRRIAWRLCGFV